MKIIKTVLITLLVIIVLLVVIAYFLPSKAKVVRTKLIKANQEVIFDQVNVLKNWEKWSPWHKMDPKMELTYDGPTSGEGAKYIWKSNNPDLGNGWLSITRCVPYDTILMDMSFMEESIAKSSMTFAKTDSGIVCTWMLESSLGMNPMYRFFGLFFDKMVGKDFENGLAGIDSLCQTLPENQAMKIEEVKIHKTPYIYVHNVSTMEEISKKMGDSYQALGVFLDMQKLQPAGYPFSIYYSWENNHFEYDAGFPVAKAMKPSGNVKCGEFPDCNAVVGWYYGTYEKTGDAHALVQQWIKDNNKKIINNPWEEYVTDPATEKDQSKWLTKVYYPIE